MKTFIRIVSISIFILCIGAYFIGLAIAGSIILNALRTLVIF